MVRFAVLLITALPLTLAAQSTRFEQDDSHITYTGTWYPNSNSLESNGSSTLTNFRGGQVIVVFNGTGITWVGTSDPYSGEAYVTLDGLPAMIDTSTPSTSTFYQQKLWAIHDLAPGLHHLTIEVMHARDSTTQGSWIWIDAFDVDNGSLVSAPVVANAGSYEQTTVSANYIGHWFQNPGAEYSGGTINGAVDANSAVDFTFNGTGVSWIGYRDQYSGTAQVYIDGNLAGSVDAYSASTLAQSTVWSTSGLSPGTHTLRILALGMQNPASGGAWVWVDGFQVSGSAPGGPPSISAGGFVSAASFVAAPNNQVAPGQIISIFGQNFTASSGANAGSIPLPTQLGPQNTSITACGKPMPLYNVFPGQINAELPLECPGAGTITATISAGGATSTQTFTVAPAAPGIFTVNASGTGDGIILHADNTLITSAKPAAAGETVVIYATGLGPTSPSFATGAAANLANNATLPVTVTIGGQPATVTYAGLTQSLVGLYQVNCVVPVGVSGSQQVVVTVGSTGASYASRAGVTMSVK
ncbi:MAG TPA: IPT/TIG domain-containing protein [Bryobacteraceae bacterium]|nr:IPT/TIG domain-containing protein [Bryobacteraceae bacterium]